ncbi:MAG: hypothetical protein FWH26_05765 [Oscillospiraceae bacterium]|nr:hypothetical protein [Oscillospiraceae bacterium]
MRINQGRIFISILLALSMSVFFFGLRGLAWSSVTRTMREAGAASYRGLDREAEPPGLMPLLLRGKYAAFRDAARPAFPVPALAQGYVPQGLVYLEALDCFALSYYHPSRGIPSLLAIVDARSGTHVKSLYLLHAGGGPYTGHAGGLAAWGRHIWVTSDGRAYRLETEDLRRAADGDFVLFRDDFRVGNRASVAFCADDTLWVGEYYAAHMAGQMDPARVDPASGNSAWCAGFPLSEEAPMGVAALRRTGDAPAPVAVLSLQDRVQGLTVGGGGELLLSSSGGVLPASGLWVYPPLKELLRQPPAYEVELAGGSRPLWVLDPRNALRRLAMPPMSEGIAAYDGRVYVLFESAAREYRGQAELTADYVFMMEDER